MTGASRAPAAARLAVWSGFLVVTLRLLHGATFGRLAIPLGSLDELAAWADHTSPAVMALAIVRLAALVGAWYLSVATLLAVVADVAGWRRLGRVVAALSPGIVGRVAARAAGVGLAAGAVLAIAPVPSRLLAAPASATAMRTEPVGGTASPAPTATPAPVPSPGTAPADGLASDADPTGTAPADGLPSDADPTGTAPAGGLGADAGPTGTGPDAPTSGDPATATMTRLARAETVPVATMTLLPGTGTASVATMTQLAWPGEPPISPADPGPADPAGLGPDPAGAARAGAGPDAAGAHTDGTGVDATDPGGAGPDIRPHPPAGGAGAGAGGDGRTVTGGDSFWSIASEVLAASSPRTPSEREVRRYWLQLVAANRDRLADPANPDLLIPGQRLRVPAPY